jgi:hypothetical protein
VFQIVRFKYNGIITRCQLQFTRAVLFRLNPPVRILILRVCNGVRVRHIMRLFRDIIRQRLAAVLKRDLLRGRGVGLWGVDLLLRVRPVRVHRLRFLERIFRRERTRFRCERARGRTTRRAPGIPLLLREPCRLIILQRCRRPAEQVRVEVDRLSGPDSRPAAVPAAEEERD